MRIVNKVANYINVEVSNVTNINKVIENARMRIERYRAAWGDNKNFNRATYDKLMTKEEKSKAVKSDKRKSKTNKYYGGLITGGRPGRDTVPINAHNGEFILNKNVVNDIGVKKLLKLNNSTKQERQINRPQDTLIKESSSNHYFKYLEKLNLLEHILAALINIEVNTRTVTSTGNNGVEKALTKTIELQNMVNSKVIQEVKSLTQQVARGSAININNTLTTAKRFILTPTT
jgi:hypothetical protein